jgi:hypothetical protein
MLPSKTIGGAVVSGGSAASPLTRGAMSTKKTLGVGKVTRD